MTTDLTRFTQWAVEKPQQRYTALMGMLADRQGLAESFARLGANKAAGVDGVRKADYEHGLEEKLSDLSARYDGWGIDPSRRDGCTSRKPTEGGAPWASRASRTGSYRIGSAVFCRRSGSRSSEIARMVFGRAAARIRRWHG